MCCVTLMHVPYITCTEGFPIGGDVDAASKTVIGVANKGNEWKILVAVGSLDYTL